MTHVLSQAGHAILLLIGAAVVVLAVGLAGYIGVSFRLMGPHTARRALGLSARAVLRELFVAAITQPFLLLFYFLGRRMSRSGRDGAVPIVFVHGYMQNRVDFYYLARSLARRGLGPTFGFNYPWFASLASNAERLERFVTRVCEEMRAPKVDLVCHSMGGLVAVEMMRREADASKLKVRRCVTIATPHAGVLWRGPLLGFGAAALRRGSQLLETHAGSKMAVPTLSVFSTHDNIVHPKESSSLVRRGGRDEEVRDVAHLAILFSPTVADHVAAFLEGEAVEAALPLERPERPEGPDGPDGAPQP